MKNQEQFDEAIKDTEELIAQIKISGLETDQYMMHRLESALDYLCASLDYMTPFEADDMWRTLAQKIAKELNMTEDQIEDYMSCVDDVGVELDWLRLSDCKNWETKIREDLISFMKG